MPTPKTNRTVSFVVLNWRGEAMTARCVASIKALESPATVKQIIVVDNASTESSRKQLEALSVDLICNAENLGFGGGINSAISNVRGDYLALINNDCLLASNWLEEGMKVLEADPQIGLIGGREFFWNDKNPEYNDANDFYSLPIINPRNVLVRQSQSAFGAIEAPYVTASNVLMTTESFKRAGGLDADFFAYYEDADLCAKLLAVGKKVMYSDKLRAWHKSNFSSNKIPTRKNYLITHNRYLFLAKQAPSNWQLRLVTMAATDLIKSPVFMALAFGLEQLKGRTPTTRAFYAMRFRAGWWALTHVPFLHSKRQANIKAGTYRDGYWQDMSKFYAELEPAKSNKS